MLRQPNHQIKKRMRPLLGTFVEIGLVDVRLASIDIDKIFEQAFNRIEKIQSCLSFHSDQSELTQLNSAKGEWINLSKDSYDCLHLAKIIAQLTDYKFNPFLGRALIQHQALPFAQIKHYHSAVNLSADSPSIDNLQLAHNKARLTNQSLICVDGIAKGFAVDKAILEIQKKGIRSAWVNAGGDIRVIGDYVMPIHQKNHHGDLIYLGGLQNAAIATSTSCASPEYPGLLLSPKGERLDHATWSVIAPRAWRADALTKVAANSTIVERESLIARFAGRCIAI